MCAATVLMFSHDIKFSALRNTPRPRQNGRNFSHDTLKRFFLNENLTIAIKNSLKVVPRVRISNITALVQIMAWRRPGDRPLSEPTRTIRTPSF